MSSMREFVVCADDAGWDEATDEVIAALVRAARVSAISVLVDGPTAADWRGTDLGADGSLGVHLHLTWSPELGSHGLGTILAAAHTGRLSQSWVTQRLAAQLRCFEALFDRPPDFVDGHQHVHALPGVREPLLALLDERYGHEGRPAVRVPLARRWRGSKAAALGWLGARRLDATLRDRGWPRNDDFAGAYDMARGGRYRERMVAWLASLGDGGLIMVHPGAVGNVEHAAARTREAAYLAGPAWPSDLRAAGARLRPFRGVARGG